MRIEELVSFIRERHEICRRRQQGLPKPWTNDPILQQWRFCNVYRELDTVTQWIAENWRDPHEEDMDVWFAMVVARFVNWPDTLAEIGYPVPWNPKHFVAVMEDRQRRKEKVFTGAYMIHADLHFSGTKAAYLAQEVFGPLWRDRRKLRKIRWGTLSAAHRTLTQYRDMGDFMVGQVIADLKYVAPLSRAADWWTWAAPGPGSRRGMNRVLGRPVDAPWSNGDWLDALTELREAIRPLLRKRLPPIHAQDLQNCLCEFDKYERVSNDEGKPRSRFNGAA